MHTRRTIAILLLAAALAQAEPANPKIVERYKQMLAAALEAPASWLVEPDADALAAEIRAIAGRKVDLGEAG